MWATSNCWMVGLPTERRRCSVLGLAAAGPGIPRSQVYSGPGYTCGAEERKKTARVHAGSPFKPLQVIGCQAQNSNANEPRFSTHNPPGDPRSQPKTRENPPGREPPQARRLQETPRPPGASQRPRNRHNRPMDVKTLVVHA